MNDFGHIYQIIWSIFAIGGGLLLLLFREFFIKGVVHGFRSWYKKTGFLLFKFQADEFDGTHIRMTTVLVAVVFILVGVFTLLKNF